MRHLENIFHYCVTPYDDQEFDYQELSDDEDDEGCDKSAECGNEDTACFWSNHYTQIDCMRHIAYITLLISMRRGAVMKPNPISGVIGDDQEAELRPIFVMSLLFVAMLLVPVVWQCTKPDSNASDEVNLV